MPLAINGTLKWFSSLPILMQTSFCWRQRSVRYNPPPPRPLPLLGSQSHSGDNSASSKSNDSNSLRQKSHSHSPVTKHPIAEIQKVLGDKMPSKASNATFNFLQGAALSLSCEQFLKSVSRFPISPWQVVLYGHISCESLSNACCWIKANQTDIEGCKGGP